MRQKAVRIRTIDAEIDRSRVRQAWLATRYATFPMIHSFRHKGLRRLFEGDDRSKVQAAQAGKIERILSRLHAAVDAQDMDLPGFRPHASKGDLTGFWAVSVSGNWRIIVRFDDGHASHVDLVDYH